MIEVVTSPSDLATWNAEQQPFYLEVFGETRPTLDISFAEVLPAGPADGSAQTAKPTPIYEYWWTVGHPGHAHGRSHLPDVLANFFGGEEDFWQRVRDPAARVYFFFPTNAGWRIKELIATLKYLSPTQDQKSLWNQAADEWKVVSPLLSNAATVAGLAAGQPWVGPAASGASSLLGAIAKLQINNVPQTAGFEWSVGKVTFASQMGVMQGVMWTLPKKVFTELGGRLTGSLALSFIPAALQSEHAVAHGEPKPELAAMLAHAVVYGPDHDYWVPGERNFLRLNLQPVNPNL